MGEKNSRDWSWTPVITVAGMHVMMTGIIVTIMLFLIGEQNNRMLSVEEKLRDLIEVVSSMKSEVDVIKQEVNVIKREVDVIKREVDVIKREVDVIKQEVSK